MQFQLTIKCDNAAFYDMDGNPCQGYEVAKILKDLAKKLESVEDVTDFEQVLFDFNGNYVGKAIVNPE